MHPLLFILLAPIAFLYGTAVYLRNYLFDIKILKSKQIDRASICIGNLTVGGTGKTPHVEYLVKLLSDKFKLAILSRGYKRKTKGFRLASAKSTVLEIGDEPYQMHCKFPKVIIGVDEKRLRGANKLIEKYPDIKLILLDDAFQHRYIKAGYSILLMDYNNLSTKDFFLPVGKLRDSVSQLYRADTVIITKCPKNIKPIDQRVITKELNLYPYQNIYFTTYNYGRALPVFPENKGSFTINEKDSLLGLAGIANPNPFFNYLKKNFNLVKTIALPDHYYFTEKKIKAIFEKFCDNDGEKKFIITTEKDAMRLQSLENLSDDIKRSFYYIPIEVRFLNESEKDFNKKILDYVRKSKRNYGLYT